MAEGLESSRLDSDEWEEMGVPVFDQGLLSSRVQVEAVRKVKGGVFFGLGDLFPERIVEHDRDVKLVGLTFQSLAVSFGRAIVGTDLVVWKE